MVVSAFVCISPSPKHRGAGGTPAMRDALRGCQRGVRELNAAGLGWICTSCSICTSGKEEQIAGIWWCFSRLKSCSGFGVVC